MTNPTEILPGVLFYSYLASTRKDKVSFLEHNALVLLVSGQFDLETSGQRVRLRQGEMLLIRKNQLAQITKSPLDGQPYESLVISLQDEVLRQMALEDGLETDRRYAGPSNIVLPDDEFLQAFFRSVIPYTAAGADTIPPSLGALKVREAVNLLLRAKPELRLFLFDFSDPHKVDLAKFMRSNFQFNIPVERFARLTGRSLSGFKRDFEKTFGDSPRRWLQDRRLEEARHLLEDRRQKPSAIYLDLGFESLAHFSHSFKKKFGRSPNQLLQP